MLKIKNLHAKVGDNEILKGLNLDVKPGEIHAIMGPNGSGKSTLAAVLAGREAYEVTDGIVELDGTDLLDLEASDRALMNNTVRLTVFARRFLIRNMQLVGARPGFIRRPFLHQGLVLGISSGLLSFALIVLTLSILKGPLGSTAFLLEPLYLIYIAAGLTFLGGFLGVLSTALAVNRYLRLDVGQLH